MTKPFDCFVPFYRVHPIVLFLRKKHKIAQSIIRSYMIFMVHYLILAKFSAKMFFHHKPVLPKITSTNKYHFISAMHFYSASPIMSVLSRRVHSLRIARPGTMRVFCYFETPILKVNYFMASATFSFFHNVIMPQIGLESK